MRLIDGFHKPRKATHYHFATSSKMSVQYGIFFIFFFSFIRIHSKWLFCWLEFKVFLVRRRAIRSRLCEDNLNGKFSALTIHHENWLFIHSSIDLKYHGSFLGFHLASSSYHCFSINFIIASAQSYR